MSDTNRLRPRPQVIPATEPFWDAAAAGRLDLPWSKGKWEPSPRPGFHDEIQWRTASSTGTVYSYSVVYFSPYDDLPAPYVLALVELDDGPRITTNLVDMAHEDVHVGMAVELTFVQLDERHLPVFRPRS